MLILAAWPILPGGVVVICSGEDHYLIAGHDPGIQNRPIFARTVLLQTPNPGDVTPRNLIKCPKCGILGKKEPKDLPRGVETRPGTSSVSVVTAAHFVCFRFSWGSSVALSRPNALTIEDPEF